MGELFTWYNVLFTAPLFFVFLFAILQIIGVSFQLGGGGGEMDVDVDADVDMDVDMDVDVDVDVDIDMDVDMDMDVDVEPDMDVDVDADMDADMDADADADTGGPGIILSALGFLNVGKVPCMVILMSLFALWGIIGLVCNSIVGGGTVINKFPLWIGVSLGAAFFGSLFGTRYLAVGLAKVFPESERATRYADLMGLRAQVTSGRVTTTFGQAVVTSPDGSRLNISCRIREGEEMPLRGDEIVLVKYIPPSNQRRSGYFEVVKVDVELS